MREKGKSGDSDSNICSRLLLSSSCVCLNVYHPLSPVLSFTTGALIRVEREKDKNRDTRHGYRVMKVREGEDIDFARLVLLSKIRTVCSSFFNFSPCTLCHSQFLHVMHLIAFSDQIRAHSLYLRRSTKNFILSNLSLPHRVLCFGMKTNACQ